MGAQLHITSHSERCMQAWLHGWCAHAWAGLDEGDWFEVNVCTGRRFGWCWGGCGREQKACATLASARGWPGSAALSLATGLQN